MVASASTRRAASHTFLVGTGSTVISNTIPCYESVVISYGRARTSLSNAICAVTGVAVTGIRRTARQAFLIRAGCAVICGTIPSNETIVVPCRTSTVRVTIGTEAHIAVGS